MPTKQKILSTSGMYFITFTCAQWLPLIDISKGYDIIYKWFDYLKSKKHYVNGFVVMPNHVHLLLSFSKGEKSINTIIGSGKRFMAYEIIKRLTEAGNRELLEKLGSSVEEARKKNNKLHDVWELSFDWKECRSRKFIRQKLDYIHANPALAQGYI